MELIRLLNKYLDYSKESPTYEIQDKPEIEPKRKKMDALEFVDELAGGWDCIIWDPPYLERIIQNRFHYSPSGKRIFTVDHTKEATLIDHEYLNRLTILIQSKTDSCVWIMFRNKIIEDVDLFFIWIKREGSGIRSGYNVMSNVEFVNIKLINYKIKQGSDYKHLPRAILSPKRASNQFTKRNEFEKNIDLIENLLKWSQCSYVLDPFAGSYSTAAACRKLGLKYDTCDKFKQPPPLLERFLD